MTATAPPPADRFCDLVMKGGITSGVVYPRAIAELSHHYHFKSIGGTSAGAIAAAVTAAAEFQRLQTGSRAGFDLLEELPDLLQEKISPRRSRLLSLFQPQPETKRLFKVLIASLNSGSTGERISRIILGFLIAYWPATLPAIVLADVVYRLLTVQGGWGMVLALVAATVAIVVTIGIWVFFDLLYGVVPNYFGLCSGLGKDRQQPALTPWLHELIQRAAGKPMDKPLTFGDLWNARACEPDWLDTRDPKARRSIDLQMFSTNLSHGRPYVFPLDDEETGPTRFGNRERLFFKPGEIRRLLPADVVDCMMQHARPYELEHGREAKDPATADGAGLYELPSSANLPILLAARMSLSFPFLFSAVPLYAIDYDPPKGKRKFARCWFSDGGISSNFPMHLFDDLVPSWPTFGINLEPRDEHQNDICLPPSYGTGYGERWDRFGDNRQPSASQLGGFLAAIIGTMQNWNDNSLARMPGFRDRIARLRLDPDEGGINLNMESELIHKIADRGKKASEELIKRFAQLTPAGGQAAGWDEHRFVRLNILLKMIDAHTPAIINALSSGCPHATALEGLLQAYAAETRPPGQQALPPGYEEPLTVELRAAMVAVIEALAVLAAEMAKAGPQPFTPVPAPELRVRPPL